MTKPIPPPRRRVWIWAALAAVALAGLGAWYLGTRQRTTSEPPAPPAASVPAATTSTLPVTVETRPTTTATSTTSTTATPTTVVAARPTTTVPATTVPATTRATTTTVAAPTTTESPAVPAEAGEHEHHDEAVHTGDICHTHDEAVIEHCHTYELPATTAPDPEATGDCPGNFHQWYKVRDDCVLSEVRKEFLAWSAGNHAQRMASIRDGHLLAGVFTQLQTASEAYFGVGQANDPSAWTSVYADADNRSTRRVELYGAQWNDPDRIDVRIRAVMADSSFAWAWNVVPFTYVDGQWKVSYQGFCRFIDTGIKWVEDNVGTTLDPCPSDPRPNAVAREYIRAAYDPTDDPTRTQVNKTPGW